MAEILCIAQTGNTNPSMPVLGDVVYIKPDGAYWGDAESLDDRIVVRISAPVESVEHLHYPYADAWSRYHLDLTGDRLEQLRAEIAGQNWFVPTVALADFVDKEAT